MKDKLHKAVSDARDNFDSTFIDSTSAHQGEAPFGWDVSFAVFSCALRLEDLDESVPVLKDVDDGLSASGDCTIDLPYSDELGNDWGFVQLGEDLCVARFAI